MAGSIDNLNFEIILKDDEFGKKVQENMKLAQQLNVSLTKLLDLQTRVKSTGIKTTSQGINEAIKIERLAAASAKRAAAEEKLTAAQTASKTAAEKLAAAAAKRAAAEQSAAAATARATKGQKAMLRAVNETNKAYQNQGRVLGELKSLALQYLSIRGVSELISSLVRVTGEFELQKTTLAAMLGDLNAAENVLTKIKGLAVESPFQFKELTTYAKQLTAFAVPANELFETTKMLADVSAGLGVGMDRLVLAYGQVKSAAFLRGQEVRQFTEAGIPILNELAKQFEKLEGKAVSAGEVFDRISKRMVSFEMVNQIFKEMTSEGGKFFNMQEVQAETLKGKISNLKDAYEMMLNEIGVGQTENLKNAVDWVRRQIKNYEEIGKIITELIVTYGVYKAALLAISIATDTFRIANSKLLSSIIGVTKWMINNPYTVIAATLTAAGYAIYKYVTALESYERVHQAFLNTKEEYEASLVSESVKLDTLYAKLKLAKEGTDEYNEAKKQIYSQYASYIAELREEGVEVENLVTLYDSLKGKVEAYTKAKFRSIAETELSETFNQEVKTIRDRYKQLVSYIDNLRKNAGEKALSAMDKEGLWQYITGDIATLFDMAENPALKELKKTLNSKTLPFGRMAKELQTELSTIRKTYADDMGAILELYGEAQEQIVDKNPFNQPLGGDEDGGKSQAQKDLEIQIDLVKKLQKAYESLRPYVDDKTMRDTLSKYFPTAKKDWIESLDFTTILKSLADELAKYDKDAAERLRYSIGTFGVDAEVDGFREVEQTYKDAAKAAEEYFNTLRAWEAEDFNIQGKGIIFDVNKITSDLQGAINKIELKATKLKETFAQIIPEDFKSTIEVYAVARIKNKELAKQFRDSLKEIDSDDIASIYKLLTEQLGEQSAESIIKTAFPALKTIQESFTKEFGADAWTSFWESFLKEGAHAIEALADKQTEYEKKKAQEKLNDLAQKYVKENTAGLNMSDWGDKTIQQIKMIQQKLESLLNNVQLPEETVKVIDALGLSTTDLIAKIKDLLGGHLENASIEKFKALSKVIKTVTEQTDKLGGALEELGDTMNSTFLKGFGSAIKYLGEFTDMMLESSLLTPSFSKKLEDASNTTGELAESAADAAENTAKSADLITMAIKIGLSLITSFVEGINESEKAFQDARIRAIEYANAINSINLDNLLKGSETIFGTDSYQQARDAMNEAKKYLATINDLQKNIQVTKEDLQDTFSASSWAVFNSSYIDKAREMANLGLGDILVDERSGWDKFWGTAGSDLIKSFNIADFFDENGILKGEELRNFYNQYSEYMSDANRQTILEMLGQWDNYAKATEATMSYLKDMMGDVADSMADSFVDSFKESGEAALDYADIMDEVATNIAKSVVKSMIIEQVADPELIKEIGDLLLSGDEAGALSLIDKAMQSAEALAPKIQAFLETMEPYFQMGGEESQNLAEGIKGMTEDTANLLASYLNAIRADVSYAKSIWERMDKNTQAIASAIASFPIPSLMEYQAQIAANTYNTSMHTQDILFELRSVIASDGGPTAIRVLM